MIREISPKAAPRSRFRRSAPSRIVSSVEPTTSTNMHVTRRRSSRTAVMAGSLRTTHPDDRSRRVVGSTRKAHARPKLLSHRRGASATRIEEGTGPNTSRVRPHSRCGDRRADAVLPHTAAYVSAHPLGDIGRRIRVVEELVLIYLPSCAALVIGAYAQG